jgi:hypothetical protein
MTMSRDDYIAEWEAQLASANRQLDYFKRGMRWKMQGVDRTDIHIAALQKTIANIEKLLANFKPAAELGSSGGKTRAERLDPARRAEIARIAAAARWGSRIDQ